MGRKGVSDGLVVREGAKIDARKLLLADEEWSMFEEYSDVRGAVMAWRRYESSFLDFLVRSKGPGLPLVMSDWLVRGGGAVVKDMLQHMLANTMIGDKPTLEPVPCLQGLLTP